MSKHEIPKPSYGTTGESGRCTKCHRTLLSQLLQSSRGEFLDQIVPLIIDSQTVTIVRLSMILLNADLNLAAQTGYISARRDLTNR